MGESVGVQASIDTASTTVTEDKLGKIGGKSHGKPLLNGGATGLEVSGGPAQQADVTAV